jgi:outer membrane lipoprotein carrier protein
MMTFSLKLMIRVLSLLLLPAFIHAAEAPAYMTNFFADLHTLQADFRQEVTDGNNILLQSSEGHMWIKRPGRFRWDYESPYRQQLVADGKHLWSYDEDLEQVTVQKAADVLTSTPAMLLSGEQPLGNVFNIEKVTAVDNEQHVVLVPKSDDSNVNRILLVFSGKVLLRIKADDNFGNATVFSFTDFDRNPALDDAVFVFTPPAGADVVGDFD